MTFVAITGPAGSGKNTLAEALAGRIGLEEKVQLINGSALFRSVAMWMSEQGYTPEMRLPDTLLDLIKFEFLSTGDVYVLREGEIVKTYRIDDYSTLDVARVASDFARTSPDVYKPFVIHTIQEQIKANANSETHSILESRDAFRIAAGIEYIPSLLVYLSITEDVQRQRIQGRLGMRARDELELLVQKELDRDRQDIASGTLPRQCDSYVSLDNHVPIQPGVVYQLDNSRLSVQEAIEILYTAFTQIRSR